MLRVLITAVLVVVSDPRLSAGQAGPLVTRAQNTIGIVGGRRTVPAQGHSLSARALRKSSTDEYGGDVRVCADRKEWKCVVGGVAVGFVVGAFIGHSLGPKPVEHHVSGDGLFGYYSYMQCDAHCDDQDKYLMPVGIGGAILGGVLGHFVARRNSQ